MVNDSSDVRIRQLLDSVLDEFDSLSLSTLIRRAQRIAKLRYDYAAQLRFVFEMTDFSGEGSKVGPELTKCRNELATLLGSDAAKAEERAQFREYLRVRTVENDNSIGSSVSKLESSLTKLRQLHDEQQVPTNLTPIDTYFVAGDVAKSKATILAEIVKHDDVIEKIRQSVHEYLIGVEEELEVGQRNSDIFQRAQIHINESLGRFAPEALAKFVSAQDRISAGGPEDYAHALTSCRRMIKALADALYPATDEEVLGIDGVARTMSDDKYKNRLTEYVRTKIESKSQRSVVVATLGDLHNRIAALDSLASKGVHDEVSASEAETCVILTYLLAGDLVRIADGSSTLVQDSPSEEARNRV